jgi:hypothetical protein
MKKNLLTSAAGLALSLGILFGTVWVISKAWQEGQKQKTA